MRDRSRLHQRETLNAGRVRAMRGCEAEGKWRRESANLMERRRSSALYVPSTFHAQQRAFRARLVRADALACENATGMRQKSRTSKPGSAPAPPSTYKLGAIARIVVPRALSPVMRAKLFRPNLLNSNRWTGHRGRKKGMPNACRETRFFLTRQRATDELLSLTHPRHVFRRSFFFFFFLWRFQVFFHGASIGRRSCDKDRGIIER